MSYYEILAKERDDARAEAEIAKARVKALEAMLSRDVAFTARHKKRGTSYEVLGIGKVQSAVALWDNDEVVIYRGKSDGKLWARKKDEFFDGRFDLMVAESET